MSASIVEIDYLVDLTTEHQNGIMSILRDLKMIEKDNYLEFNDLEKQKIGALVNHIKSLSALLNKKVS